MAKAAEVCRGKTVIMGNINPSDKIWARELLARGAKDLAKVIVLAEHKDMDAYKRGELHKLELRRSEIIQDILEYLL